ncbi:extracellular solute-binding protein [Paenibacillus agaridevorans]|uniref:extracellular solute-binding protein n=1 Tax=Paenibacillus agaridevorans TaxID=171404 RepID=UPI001BE45927|nr:extracellular solute-binding protein [Paenibacillus agaridevorans]
MKFRAKRKMGLLLTMALMLSSAVACSNNGKGANEPSPSAPTNSQQSSAPSETKGEEASTYPLQSDAVLTYWAPLNANLTSLKSNYGEVPFYQELQKRTGVKLEFTNPPVGQEQETFNVLLASGQLPDMMEWDWRMFPGGPEKAIDDGYILALNELIDQYAPNLKKYLAEHPEVDKQIKSDSGKYYAFPFIRGDDSLKVYQGPIIRKDWLDELGLPVPVTIEDWHKTLTAFKEKKGATSPLSMYSFLFTNGAFVGAWGVTQGFYLENGQVKYGPMEQGYKEFLTTMRQWYKEGLLDKNFATLDGKALDANITTGGSGATVMNAGSGIGKWLEPLKKNAPNAELVAAPYPVLKAGDKPKFGQKDFSYASANSVAINAKSKNAVLAVQMLDYGYSEEGHTFFNFGNENESHTLVNGEPAYTDLIMKNPDQLATAQAISMYTHANHNGPFVQDKLYIQQFYTLPQQKDAIHIWQTDAEKYMLPPISPTQSESAEFAAIMNDVNTLVSETSLKMMMGAESIDSFDRLVEQLKSLKIDRAIEIQSEALTRYQMR